MLPPAQPALAARSVMAEGGKSTGVGVGVITGRSLSAPASKLFLGVHLLPPPIAYKDVPLAVDDHRRQFAALS